LSFPDAFGWLAGLPLRGKLLAAATLVVVIELALRRFARKSRAYARWTGFFQAIGNPLDRGMAPEPTFWRAHEANPLGPERAARHQF
jgi:hypothetical protein